MKFFQIYFRNHDFERKVTEYDERGAQEENSQRSIMTDVLVVLITVNFTKLITTEHTRNQ